MIGLALYDWAMIDRHNKPFIIGNARLTAGCLSADRRPTRCILPRGGKCTNTSGLPITFPRSTEWKTLLSMKVIGNLLADQSRVYRSFNIKIMSVVMWLSKKRKGYCNGLRPSVVCPLCYLLLNQWTKFNQFWCWVTHMQRHFFGRAPEISFNFNYKVKFKDFFYTKLVVCSHKWKIQTYQMGF